MSKVTQQQKQFRILVVGDACLDVYIYGDCERLSPEAPVPVFKKNRVEYFQGMCLNVAANIRSFGHQVKIDNNKEKIKKTRLVDEKFGHHLLRFDDEPDLTRIDLSKYTVKSMKEFDAMVISDYDKGYIRQGDILDLIEPARSLGIPVFVDSKKNNLKNFEECIIKINEKESLEVSSLPPKSKLIVTLGKEGAKFNGKIYPSKKVEVHDVCGAGDVFLAGLVHKYLMSGGNIENAIEFANNCASVSVGHFGTYVLSKGDINDLCV